MMPLLPSISDTVLNTRPENNSNEDDDRITRARKNDTIAYSNNDFDMRAGNAPDFISNFEKDDAVKKLSCYF